MRLYISDSELWPPLDDIRFYYALIEIIIVLIRLAFCARRVKRTFIRYYNSRQTKYDPDKPRIEM